MTTALAVYSSDGCEGRCDAKCHTAQEPECDCVCGGRNHAKGSSQQVIADQTKDWFGSLEAAEAWAREHGIAQPDIRGRKAAEKPLESVRQLELV